MSVRLFFFFPILICLCLRSVAQISHPVFELQVRFTGLSSPVDLVNAGDGSGRLFVVERGGVIKVIKNGAVLSTPFLDIDARVLSGGERGLLGLAFHPNYVSNGYFYVHYTDNSGDSKIARFERSSGNADVADAASEFTILEIDQPQSNHNGGCLRFGPDGYLYIAMGDGGGGGDPSNYAQNPNSLLGKMLRIDVDGGSPYAIPNSNPFVGNANVLDEIWALGLRNPWRFNFDAQTGDLWIADVGQGDREEVNFQPASSQGGENYGWRCYEGNLSYNTTGCSGSSAYVFPVFYYGRNDSNGGRSISGGTVYRGSDPCMQGFYFCADYASNNLWTIVSDGNNGWSAQIHKLQSANSIVAFGTSEMGNLYTVSLNGTIAEIVGGDFTLEGDPIPTGAYQSQGSISVRGRLTSGSSLSLSAGDEVQLLPELEVESGADLQAQAGGCNQ